MENSDDYNGSAIKVQNNKQTIATSCGTLNDEMPFAPVIEDISVLCKKCKEFIYYGDIVLHRRLHNCFHFLQIDDAIGFQGLTFKILAKQRNKFIKHSKKYPAAQRQSIISKVDVAYSTIYNYLIDEHRQEVQFSRFIKEEPLPYKYGYNNNRFKYTKSSPLFSDIVICMDIDYAINYKLQNQEPYICAKNISDVDACFALVSGINGNCAKKYVSEHMMKLLESNYYTGCSENDRLSEAIDRTIVDMDLQLSTGLYDTVTYKSWSGCCIELVIISKISDGLYHLTAANIGDGMVVLIKTEGYRVISTLHSMANENEVKRIKNLGGTKLFINDEFYLNGTTSTTQVLGGYGNGRLKQFQIPNMKCCKVEINFECDLGVMILNRELAKMVPVEDAVQIFKSEIAMSPSTPDSLPSTDQESSEISYDVMDTDSLKSLYDLSLNSLEGDVGDVRCYPVEETRSRVIARKLVNASLLCSSNDCSVGAVAFVFKTESDQK